jgi:hypothetical protein
VVARSIPELEKIWIALEHSKRFSDGLISIAGIGILGVNGLIAIASSTFNVPGEALFELWTVGISLYLLGLAASARASPGTMFKVMVFIAADMFFDLVPVAGGFVDAAFRAPRMAANAIQKEIEQTHWVDASWREVRATGSYQSHVAEMRAQGKKRVVFLRD